MTMIYAARLLSALMLLAPLVLTLQTSRADAQGQPARVQRAPTYEQQQEKINAWTVGLAAGLIEGAPLRLAAEMARVLRPGGRLVVVTLDAHEQPEVTAPYGHVHPGFKPAALRRLLTRTDLVIERCDVTSRERREPHFRVVTAVANRPEQTRSAR